MRFFPGFFRKRTAASHHAAASWPPIAMLLLAGSALALHAAAQQQGSDGGAQPEPPPAPAVFHNPIPADQLDFLNSYVGQPAKVLVKDKRFHNLMKLLVPRTVYHYGIDMPLAQAMDEALDGSKIEVHGWEGRYVLAAGNGGEYLRGRGFAWFDLKEGIALGGFYFQPTNGEPTPTLAIFSRQLHDEMLSIGQLPVKFAENLGEWTAGVGIPPVTVRYFIPENGKKYVLVHDEDYCDHTPGDPAPPEAACQQLNAEAAEADMNGAYFMHQTHNQANATAWMLGQDQVVWIGTRNSTCGAALPCRIRLARRRTRVLMRPFP